MAVANILSKWPNLLTHCGPYDACPGIQLVLTALLGQFYAILSNVCLDSLYSWGPN
jgi:hypothetical protein